MGTITPYVEITAIDYGDRLVEAGTDFKCTVTVTVTSGDEAIENAVVQVKLPYGLSFGEMTDRVYLGTIQPGYSYDAVFLLHVDGDVRQSVCTLETYVSGVSSVYGIPIEMREDVQIGIARADRIEIRNLILPDEVNAAYNDGSRKMTFELENKGDTEIRDVEIYLKGENLSAEEVKVIDQLPPLGGENVTLNIQPETEGELEGELVVSYLSSGGERKELREDVQINAYYERAELSHNIVIDPGIIQPEPLFPDWVWGLSTFGVITGGIIIFRKIHRILMRKLEK